MAYFFIGYSIAYGVNFFSGARLMDKNGFPADRSSSCSPLPPPSRPSFPAASPSAPNSTPTDRHLLLLVGFVYPFFEGIAWNQHLRHQAWLKASFGEEFHDFAGSVVVHAMGGWIALPAVLLLGARYGRYSKDGAIGHPPSSIPSWPLAPGS